MPLSEESEDENHGDETFPTSKQDLLTELMEETENARGSQWESSFRPLRGNIYALLYINRIVPCDAHRNPMSKVFGIFSVMLIQLISPCALLFWALYQIDWERSRSWPKFVRYERGSDTNGVSHVTKVLLSVLFLACFTLNGVNVIRREEEMHIKLEMLINYADDEQGKVKWGRKDFNRFWSTLGVLVNATMPVTCSIVLFVLFILAESPKDVVFDSMGLIFLFSLDDISGDLGLVTSEDWDEERLGRFYFEMVNPKICTERYPNLANDAHLTQTFKRRFSSKVFWISESILRILVFTLPPAFFFTDGVKPRSERI